MIISLADEALCWSRPNTDGISAQANANLVPGGRDFFTWLVDLPWNRVGVWAVVVWFMYSLKDFFGIAMGTFILSFIGNGFVKSAQRARLFPPQISPQIRRKILVLVYFTAIVSCVTLFGVMTIPDIIRESADFVTRLQSDSIWVVVLEKIRHGLGDGMMDQLERFMLVASGDELTGTLGSNGPQWQEWTSERTAYLGTVLQKMLRGYTEAAVSVTSALVTFVSRFALQVGVSMVLSFMVVWDLPAISKGISSLRSSRLSAIYNEVAPSLSVFGMLFGKALQAQAQIAMVNTTLTAAGMWALAIPGLGLLSLFVFICSFIPIAGCFISTIPVAFVALTEYGFLKLSLVVLMVTLIHFIEAYGLNPAIYSAHLKLHPLLVLTVLVVAEHSLGVWGLLLAVPVTVYTMDYIVRYPACSMTDVAARELATVSISDYGEDDEVPYSSRFDPWIEQPQVEPTVIKQQS
ncbi:g1445 [Coccomyxa viridis]|uniref:G1445 protein n=1 Tax=Coccomyxa viridis TaxID=1274662 RepID=A0ABP1FLU4_9CHLO